MYSKEMTHMIPIFNMDAVHVKFVNFSSSILPANGVPYSHVKHRIFERIIVNVVGSY